MFSSARDSSRWWRLIVAATGVALVYSAMGTQRAFSDTAANVVQVEEDWELVVANPDNANTAPQVTCTISPYPHLNNLHSVVEINHKTVPSFAAGGVHLQTWVGEYNLTRKSIESTASLATSNEVITWTSRMKLTLNSLNFSVQNGQSTTWGTFGGGTTLHSVYGTSLLNLDSYSPDFSVANSGVGFANNRVKTLTLKRVRYTLLNGQVITDDTPRVVHQTTQQLEPE
jgi:hypothetical protein